MSDSTDRRQGYLDELLTRFKGYARRYSRIITLLEEAARTKGADTMEQYVRLEGETSRKLLSCADLIHGLAKERGIPLPQGFRETLEGLQQPMAAGRTALLRCREEIALRLKGVRGDMRKTCRPWGSPSVQNQFLNISA